MHLDLPYLNLLQKVLDTGTRKSNRTGTDTLRIFGAMMEFDLSNGEFPLLTSKLVHTKSVFVELLWFLKGLTNLEYLHKYGVKIWDEWADENGDLGRIYGAQWRDFFGSPPDALFPVKGLDQIKKLVDRLISHPECRRHIVTAWNPYELSLMRLPPCHHTFQCDVSEGKLSLITIQRSCDMFLGIPFNIASYAALLNILCWCTGLRPGKLISQLGDVHIYVNHIEQVKEQLSRWDKLPPSPSFVIRRKFAPGLYPWDLEYEDLGVLDYNPLPSIKGQVSV